jgi:hypothetical protein
MVTLYSRNEAVPSGRDRRRRQCYLFTFTDARAVQPNHAFRKETMSSSNVVENSVIQMH